MVIRSSAADAAGRGRRSASCPQGTRPVACKAQIVLEGRHGGGKLGRVCRTRRCARAGAPLSSRGKRAVRAEREVAIEPLSNTTPSAASRVEIGRDAPAHGRKPEALAALSWSAMTKRMFGRLAMLRAPLPVIPETSARTLARTRRHCHGPARRCGRKKAPLPNTGVHPLPKDLLSCGLRRMLTINSRLNSRIVCICDRLPGTSGGSDYGRQRFPGAAFCC